MNNVPYQLYTITDSRLDIGEGREINPKEREDYKVVIEDGKFLYKKSGQILDTSCRPRDAKWFFVLSTSKNLALAVGAGAGEPAAEMQQQHCHLKVCLAAAPKLQHPGVRKRLRGVHAEGGIPVASAARSSCSGTCSWFRCRPRDCCLGELPLRLRQVFEINDVKAWTSVLISVTYALGHDRAHKSFSRNKLVQDIVGTLGFMPLIF
ncbi:hypothetical protein U9M48_007368 [Paspalum notatum var. saurae]|uniref:Uncharacterized protein n=1 Tax=Paspalum notatum var. saurae TaxID=547442 RepID=A0AAQ3PU63_PASNO